jgi:phosphonate transport system ATP-binding protein
MNGALDVMIYALDNVSKSYPFVMALDGVTFGVRQGEQLAVLGPSGSGKSTLFRLLNATLRPSSGSLSFDGSDTAAMGASTLRAMRRRTATIYQQHNLVPSLTALENTLAGALGRWTLLHTLRNRILPAAEDADRALHALELVSLADKRNTPARDLSGGQQQRVAIARALMQSPDVILADEPIASLDPELSRNILELLVRIASDGKRTLVVALHSVEIAKECLPRLVALQAGKVFFDAAPPDVEKEQWRCLYSLSPKDHGSTADAGRRPRIRCV